MGIDLDSARRQSTDNRTIYDVFCDDCGAILCSVVISRAKKHSGLCLPCKLVRHTPNFIAQSKKRYPRKFKYSRTVFRGTKTKVTITCIAHGDFETTPGTHLKKGGSGCCPQCAMEKFLRASQDKKRKCAEEFVSRCKERYPGAPIDYSLVDYKSIDQEVTFVCKIHGTFKTTPHHYLSQVRGNIACPKCCDEQRFEILRECNYVRTHEQFEKFKKELPSLHGGKFNYPDIDRHFKGMKIPIPIECSLHGIFWQTPTFHWHKKNGCPSCNASKGEERIANWLSIHEVVYTREKSFNDCRRVYPLAFDFYVRNFNMCIEFDGPHHFSGAAAYFGTEKQLAEIRERDAIKNRFCKDNNITLIRISYKDFDRIEEILEEALKEFAA